MSCTIFCRTTFFYILLNRFKLLTNSFSHRVRKKMLKKELADQVSTKLSLQKQDVNLAVDVILTKISEALKEGRRVELRGFGSFSTRSRKPRSTKNPRTGVVMDIPERKTLHFTMSKSLKEALIIEKE